MEMRGIEPRSDMASSGLLRAQFTLRCFRLRSLREHIDRQTYSYKCSAYPYDKGRQQWPFKLMPGTELKAGSGRQTGLALRQRVRSQCA